jgi:hypothetical protein
VAGKGSRILRSVVRESVRVLGERQGTRKAKSFSGA